MTIKVSASFILPKDQRGPDYRGMTQEHYTFEGQTDKIAGSIVRTVLAFWAGTHEVSLEDMSEVVEKVTDELNLIQTGLTKQIAGN
jgi:hypothetical protein